MAATKQELFNRLKGFVPTWFFEEDEDGINEAIFFAIAAVQERVNLALEEHIKETFICQAEGGYLDEHGLERNLERTTGEINANFAQRIKNITNTTSCDEIKRVVDALLQVGEATIVEDGAQTVFFNRESFLNRGEILVDAIENAFSIIVDNQVPVPLSFLNREQFLNREDFIGRQASSLALFQLIVDTVNKNKACGARYRLIERVG